MIETPSVVLIVDDNENNRDVLERRIARYGHIVETAENGREALDKIRARSYDLVLLDIMMPEMNGYQLLERVKQDPEYRNLPIIVISAIDDVESIVRCIKLGAEDYLPKPFNPSILKARISASLEKKRLRDQEEAHLEDQAISQRIARELNTRLSLSRAAELTLDWAMKRTSAHAGFIARILDSGEEMVIVAVAGHSQSLQYYQNTIIPIESDSLQKAVKTILPQSSVDREDYWLTETKSRVVIPIGRGGQVLALLILEDASEARYSNRTLSFLTSLSDRSAIAMSNALLYEQVQKANHAKTEFISEVSHELKNPMTSIRNYAKMLPSVGPVNDVQQRFIETIINNVDRMAGLVSDLSDISRIESGHLRLELEKVSLADVLADVAAGFMGQIEEKKQQLVIDLPDLLPPVRADSGRLGQILTNLLSNAHKYTLEGGHIRITANLMPDERAKRPLVLVAIEDSGQGLTEADKEKIFTKYFRSPEGQASGTPGTGLGLRITKQLVELQGGQIWFESEYQQGSTFYFTIPICRPGEELAADDQPAGEGAVSDR